MKKLIIFFSLIGLTALAGSFGGSTVPPGTGVNAYLRNGSATLVSEDTVTPANSRPLPVQLFGSAFPGAVDQGASGNIADPWFVKPCDGTNCQSFLATGEGLVSLTTPLPAGTNNIGSITDITGTVSLPTGASTEAKQDAQIVLETSIDGKLNSLGQKAMAASMPVVIASDQSAFDVNVASSVLPTGAATEATLASILVDTGAIDTSTSSIDSKLGTLGQKNMAGSAPVVIASDQSDIPITATSLPLPTGAATEATLASILVDTGAIDTSTSAIAVSASSIDGKLGSLGQKTMAGSAPVVIASDQSAIDTVVTSSALPTGAATEATLSAISAQLPATLGQKTMANGLAVSIASDQSAIPSSQSGTWNINDISGTISLPTGASTSANQTTGNASLSSIDGKLANNFGVATGALRTAAQLGNSSGAADFNYGVVGAQTMRSAAQIGNATGAADFGAGNKGAQTLRVVIATDQSTIPVSAGGGSTTGTFATGSISAVTTLTAPAGATGFMIQAEDTNTANLRFSSGTAASATSGIQLQPGRSETFDLGANVSICPESGTQKYSIQWKSP